MTPTLLFSGPCTVTVSLFSLVVQKILHESALLSGQLNHSELLQEAGGLSLMNSHLLALFLGWFHLQNSSTRLFKFYFGIRRWDMTGSSV